MTNGVHPSAELQKTEVADKYLSKPNLRSRGWTDGLIDKLLGEPDRKCPNPHYRSGGDMALYLASRVEATEAEHQVALDDARQKHARRCEAAHKALRTKRKRTKQRARAMITPPPRWPLPKLVQRACEDYNQRPSYVGTRWEDDWVDAEDHHRDKANPNSDKAFLDRICVNFLRHCLTSYDDAIVQEGKVGGRQVYKPVRCKALQEIAKVYPELAEECQRQMEPGRVPQAGPPSIER